MAKSYDGADFFAAALRRSGATVSTSSGGSRKSSTNSARHNSKHSYSGGFSRNNHSPAYARRQADARRARDARAAARMAAADRRRSVADRRSRFQRASAIVDRAPGILSAVLALVLLVLVGSRFFYVVAGTSQMEMFFEADMQVTDEHYPVWGMHLSEDEETGAKWYTGSYLGVQTIFEEIDELAKGKSTPLELFMVFSKDMAQSAALAFGPTIFEALKVLTGWWGEEEADGNWWDFLDEPSIMLPNWF